MRVVMGLRDTVFLSETLARGESSIILSLKTFGVVEPLDFTKWILKSTITRCGFYCAFLISNATVTDWPTRTRLGVMERCRTATCASCPAPSTCNAPGSPRFTAERKA